MEELRFALLILGGCAIVAILAHGLWSLRKNNKPTEKPRVEPVSYKSDADGFDELGIGEVRVVSNANTDQPDRDEILIDDTVDEDIEMDGLSNDEAETIESSEMQVNEVETAEHSLSSESLAEESEIDVTAETPLAEEEPKKLYGSVVTNPKPTVKYDRATREPASTPSSENSDIPEPPSFLLNESNEKAAQAKSDTDKDEVASFSLDETPSAKVAEPTPAAESVEDVTEAAQPKRAAVKKRTRTGGRKTRVEPSLGDDQMRIDFDNSIDIKDEPSLTASESPNQESSQAKEQEVLVLNVRAPNDQAINGSALLPMLLTLGFKFGDQDIFHRHVNSNGKGPVLFSLANMFKPGVFDIDNLENFTTQGVSLFMILPIEGDPHQVFNMMHNAARKLAEEFSCQILDGRRSVLTKQGLQQYVEKIREFERQRMIARS